MENDNWKDAYLALMKVHRQTLTALIEAQYERDRMRAKLESLGVPTDESP